MRETDKPGDSGDALLDEHGLADERADAVASPTSPTKLEDFFANNVLGSGVKWDTVEPALTINMTVSFMQSCTFDMTLFGKAMT